MITYERYNALRDDMPENIEELYILFDFIELKNTYFFYKKKCYFEINKRTKYIIVNSRFVNGVIDKRTKYTIVNSRLVNGVYINGEYNFNDRDYKQFIEDVKVEYKIVNYKLQPSDFSYEEKILNKVKR
ncbi:hypothetical protein M0Q50_05385 [bacterium]|jgi:hypothetical protein|nr:hypothetical protein [bacterium]